MMKKVIVILLVAFISSSIFIGKVNAAAETLGDLRREYESLLREKQDNDNKSAEAKNEIAQKQSQIAQAEKDLTKAEADQKDAEKAIEDSNDKIVSLKKESEKVLMYMQQIQGQNAYLEYVTGATDMTELITRLEAVKQVSGYISTTVSDLKTEIKKNEDLTEELKEKQKKLDAEIERYKNKIVTLTESANSYDKFALGINDKLKAAKDSLDANEKICRENLGRTDDDVKLSECSKVPVNGRWMMPLTEGIITSTIGWRWGSYHNALDIGGNWEGTPVYAAASGTVASILWHTSCGGNRVYIYVTVDGKQYTTFYYHLLEIKVNVGDIVDQNTVIGTVGGGTTSTAYGGYDACTTGAHLHYGVAEGWYPYHVGEGYVITPPGLPNYEGYSFSSRLDFYQ